ncbi:MAG TPA: hypothetical protein VFL10_10075, partial [Ornithinibacter sp.]|nr:hypothetical protein [Ornithinibacter sp.]
VDRTATAARWHTPAATSAGRRTPAPSASVRTGCRAAAASDRTSRFDASAAPTQLGLTARSR